MTDISKHTTMFSGKPYVMVSGRVLLAHDGNKQLSIMTDVVEMTDKQVTMKATVVTEKGTFTGHATSYTTTGSPQERKSPLEVAETSAVGRALGFAGYAIESGIASADEMRHRGDDYQPPAAPPQRAQKARKPADAVESGPIPPPSELQARYAAALADAPAEMKDKMRESWAVMGLKGKVFDELAPAVQWRAVEMLEEIRGKAS